MDFLKSLFRNKKQEEAEIKRILSINYGAIPALLKGCERLDAIEDEDYESVEVEYTHDVDDDDIDLGVFYCLYK